MELIETVSRGNQVPVVGVDLSKLLIQKFG